MSINYSGFAFPKPEKKEKEKITRIKGKKHKQTKKTDISKAVKKVVWKGNNILGIKGCTLKDKYNECYCIKVPGNSLDYEIIKKEEN